MAGNSTVHRLSADKLGVIVATDLNHPGKHAAEHAITKIGESLKAEPAVRMIFAAAPSRDELRADRMIYWSTNSASGIGKPEAVRKSLTGTIDESCPATMLRIHPDAVLFFDRDLASKFRDP